MFKVELDWIEKVIDTELKSKKILLNVTHNGRHELDGCHTCIFLIVHIKRCQLGVAEVCAGVCFVNTTAEKEKRRTVIPKGKNSKGSSETTFWF